MESITNIDYSNNNDMSEDCLYPQNERIMGKISYLFAWLGGCVSIGTFTMGSSLIGTINIFQAVIAMILGCTITAIGLMLNGKAGHKYGISFTVQTRSAFGVKGSKIAGIIRAVPAVVWFGFQSWVGSQALNEVSKSLIGYDNIIVFFIGFQIIQVAMAVGGFKGIKWLENIGCIFIIVSLIYMFYSVVKMYGAQLSNILINVKGTWGMPFFAAVTSFLGINTTMMLNVCDYSRELKTDVKTSTTGIIYWIAVIPATLFMGLIGLMVSSATGIADPINVFSSAVDNKGLVIITLIFIAFAQVTTNILNNIIPPAYVIMDAFKVSYKKSIIIVGILSFFTFPWLLVKPESATGLQLFVQIYSAFLGPIFTVLIVDYFILKKQNLEIDELYNENGKFKGVNKYAVISIIVGAAFAFLNVQISWFLSIIPTGITYYILMKKSRSNT